MSRMSILFLLGLTSQLAAAQDVVLYGRVREHERSQPIPEAVIGISSNGVHHFSLRCDSTGRYEVSLDVGRVWRVLFSAPGRVAKLIEYDLRDTPKYEGGYGTNVDIRLFLKDDRHDLSFLDEPLGKCRYDSTDANIQWDMEYTAPRLARLAALYPAQYELPPDTIPASGQ